MSTYQLTKLYCPCSKFNPFCDKKQSTWFHCRSFQSLTASKYVYDFLGIKLLHCHDPSRAIPVPIDNVNKSINELLTWRLFRPCEALTLEGSILDGIHSSPHCMIHGAYGIHLTLFIVISILVYMILFLIVLGYYRG